MSASFIALPFILFIYFIPVIIFFLVLYFVIKLAIRNALREHEQDKNKYDFK